MCVQETNRESVPAGPLGRGRVRGVLLLEDLRLQVVTPSHDVLGSVVGMLVPACSVEPGDTTAQWRLEVEQGAPGLADGFDDGRLSLELPYGGRRLSVVCMEAGVMRLVARYRPGAPLAVMRVDAAARATRLVVTSGDSVGVRWADWLARVFFASRLLASGWRMLHASAVAVEGTALLFLAGQHGGKSTLAHRAVWELGARFLADDLVFVGPNGQVVGWPTRVAVPAPLAGGLAGGRRERSVVAGVVRERILFTPAQHRAALGVTYSPPVRLGAVVVVDGSGAGEDVRAHAAGAGTLERVVARAADIPEQLLYVSDPLGLMGGPRLAEQAAGAGPLSGLLSGVPVAVLRAAMAQLPTALVWRSLEDLVPQVGRCQ